MGGMAMKPKTKTLLRHGQRRKKFSRTTRGQIARLLKESRRRQKGY